MGFMLFFSRLDILLFMSDLFDIENFDESDESLNANHESEQFAFDDADAILNSRVLANKSYMKNGGGATSETEKEFELLRFYLSCGSGRSVTYIANTFNLQDNKVLAISKKNYWAERASDYDIDMLQQKLRVEQDSRAIEHKKRLEAYRLQQEFLGRNLSANAAKLAALSQRTLDEYLENDRSIDIRDIPSILNSAAKIAEVGKNLQSGALGVEQLLVALEEADFDE
jgi:hypothetical protein